MGNSGEMPVSREVKVAGGVGAAAVVLYVSGLMYSVHFQPKVLFYAKRESDISFSIHFMFQKVVGSEKYKLWKQKQDPSDMLQYFEYKSCLCLAVPSSLILGANAGDDCKPMSFSINFITAEHLTGSIKKIQDLLSDTEDKDIVQKIVFYVCSDFSILQN